MNTPTTSATVGSLDKPLPARTLMAYSGITIPMAAMGMPVAVYLPRFYTEGLGLSLVETRAT